jgi:hypothetical protein
MQRKILGFLVSVMLLGLVAVLANTAGLAADGSGRDADEPRQ